MKILNSGNVVRLPLDQIAAGTRLRRVSPVQVDNLLAMAEDTGITTPIHVRKVGTGYELIDEAHRLAAAYELGLPDIACLVVECRQDEARAMEASNNPGAARMSPLRPCSGCSRRRCATRPRWWRCAVRRGPYRQHADGEARGLWRPGHRP